MHRSLASRGNRGKTYSSSEDQTLCTSLLSISHGKACATQKGQTTFWQRVSQDYNTTIHVDQTYRSASSLRNRWLTIRTEISKFCGYLAEVEAKNPIGYDESEMIIQAKAMYYEIQKKQFPFENCWNYLLSHSKQQESVTTNNQSNMILEMTQLAPSTSDPSTPMTSVSIDSDIDLKQLFPGEGSNIGKDDKELAKWDYDGMMETPSSQIDSPKNRDYDGAVETWSSQKESQMQIMDFEATMEISSAERELAIKKRHYDDSWNDMFNAFRVKYSIASGGNRGKTYCHFEDRILCSSFLSISQEQSCATQKMETTFWERVQQDYNHQIQDAKRYRSAGSLRNRWCTIRTEIAEFCGYLAEVESGQQSVDMIREAKNMYYKNHKKRFLFENCWNFLRSHNNWEELITTSKQSKKIPALTYLAPSTSTNSMPSVSLDSDVDLKQPLSGEESNRSADRNDEKDSPNRDHDDMVETSSLQKESQIMENMDCEGKMVNSFLQKESPIKNIDYDCTVDILPSQKGSPKKKRIYEGTVETTPLRKQLPKKRKCEGVVDSPSTKKVNSSRDGKKLFDADLPLLSCLQIAGMMLLMSSGGA